MKAYIAAPIFSEHQLAVVEGIKELLEFYQYDVFSPYHASREIWKGRAPKDCSPEERAAVLEGNIENLRRPTGLLLAWVGGGKSIDTGVAWEMGFYHNRITRNDYSEFGVRPVTIAYIDPSDERQDMNLMLAGTVTAAARGVTELRRAVGIKDYALLRDEFHPDRLIKQESKPIS